MTQEAKKKILIVDDETDILEALSSLLRRSGYIVSAAETGKGAIELAKKERPHLLILDLMLPDVDGSDVAIELFGDPLTRDIPIIFLTSVLTKSEQKASGEMIANRCIIAKPCRSEEILGLVKDRIGPAV